MSLPTFLVAAFIALTAGTALSLFACAPAAQASASCAATSVSSASFGSPNLLPGAAVDTTTTVNISCAGLTEDRVTCLSLDAGSAGTAGANRLMANGGETIAYNLYQDSARTIPWGSRTNGSLGTVPDMLLPAGTSTTSVTIYGRIAGGQSTTAPGAYSSTFAGASEANFYVLDSAASGCMTGAVDGAVTGAAPVFSVSATPGVNCNLATNPLDFGTHGLLNADIDATTTLTVQCTNTSPYNVGLDAGQAAAATVTSREMTFGAAVVSYALYLDAGRTQVWGDTIGTDTLAATGTGANQTITVYGRVPTQTTPQPGTYADTVVATVTY